MCICDRFLSIWTNTGLHLIHHKQKSHLGCLWSKWTEHRKWMRMTIKLGGIKIKYVIFCHYCDIDYFQAGFLNNPFVFHWSCKQNCPNSCHWLSQWPKVHKRWWQCLRLTMIGWFTSQCNDACLSFSLDQYDWLISLSMGLCTSRSQQVQ